MIHIFQIHSYTCYLSAIGVLEKEKITADKVVFILCRNLPIIRKDIKNIRIEDELYYFPYLRNNKLHKFEFVKCKQKIKEVDEIINRTLVGQFIYYVHNSRNYLYRVIITHAKCYEVRFIEDGLDMYLDKLNFELKYPAKVWYRHRIINYILGKTLGVYKRLYQPDNPFHNKGTEVIRIFGLTDISFQKFIDPEYQYHTLDNRGFRSVQNYRLVEGSNLFVFSALVEQQVAKRKEIDSFLHWYVIKFKITTLNINFHPHQSENTRRGIINLLEGMNIEIFVIPDEIIMEVLFINNKHLNVFGLGTSLLIYAAFFSPSSQVHALYPYFKKHLNVDTIRTKYWANTFSGITVSNFKLYLRDFE